jgi:hypothetical protein
MASPNQLKKMLDACRVKRGSPIFAIGPYFRNGVTLYKQQVRALNLLFALRKCEEQLKNGVQVAVIGGGVAGATAAAGAGLLGCDVDLFEQRTVLCHLQHGCETRWLHPRIYDWPKIGADSPYAALPILTWKAGTAADVAQQVTEGFEKVVSESTARIRKFLGATTRVEMDGRVQWDNSTLVPRGGEKKFDLVILAAGFGVEKGVHDGSAPSYWRNDSLNQPRPGVTSEKRTAFLISGTGDGGLIDLARTRIEMFNQSRLIDELVLKEDSDLVAALRGIHDDWNPLDPKLAENAGAWLSGRFASLSRPGTRWDRDLLAEVRERVKKRLRKDTAVILNGQSRIFQQALRLDQASLFNALIAHLLYELEGFTYVSGKCMLISPTEAEITRNPEVAQEHEHKERYQVDQVILRHGTNRHSNLCLAGVPEKEAKKIESQQEAAASFDAAIPAWPAGWWILNSVSASLDKEPIEFVPPTTQALATTFVATLNDVMRSKQGADLEFRITLHRLVQFQDEEVFQQISRYAGTRTEGNPGRVINARAGLVGLVCRLGKPVVLKKEADWESIWKHLNLVGSGAMPINVKVNSMLACPFFAPKEAADNASRVSLVLFMDSEDRDLFTTGDVLKIVFAGSRGFVSNLDGMVSRNELRVATTAYRGVRVEEADADKAFLDAHKGTVIHEHPAFNDFADALTFKQVSSFDMYL